jgi:hypothetical protein
VLVAIRDGAWDGDDLGPERVDAMNREGLERSRATELELVRCTCLRARGRMLAAFGSLAEVPPEGDEWFDESGPRHYAEHADDLEAWAGRLRTDR